MNDFIIFQMQATAGLITFYFAFKWFVFPRLAKLSIYDALVPMVLIHGLRYPGMVFMVDTQVYEAFPDDLAFTVGFGITAPRFWPSSPLLP